MIESLHIEDLGVIQCADVPLGPGLTALTGETGAGKTMVLTSLGLLLGERAETSAIRTGAERALVEGTWVLDPTSPAAVRAQEAGAELEEDTLLVSRTVPRQGRSRAHMGGRSVPSGVLAEVGSRLLAVHGQADQLRLRSAAAQRAALDSLGGAEHAALCRRYAAAHRARRQAAEELASWEEGAAARAEEAAGLRTALEALERLDPQPGEDHELAAEASRLDHAEELRRAALAARAAITGDEDLATDTPTAAGLLAGAHRALEAVASLDPRLADLARRVHELGYLAADAAADLTGHLASLDADPARLAWVQDRRAALSKACRETGGPTTLIEDVDALLAWSRTAAERLALIDGPQAGSAALTQALAEADAELGRLAQELTQARRALAAHLEAAVTAELEGLQMKGSRFVVGLEPLDEPGPTGAETVSLLLVSHPGAPALPLGKGASGGELSRIMLALEVVLADAGRPGAEPATTAQGRAHARTFVFDEIDAGVGGRAALEIGRRLARLARNHQVVVVTHLAQVAAWATTQLVVVKEPVPEQEQGAGQAQGAPVAGVRTRVVPVTGPERERELARMLSGHEDSASALRHAAELLAEAGVAQSQP